MIFAPLGIASHTLAFKKKSTLQTRFPTFWNKPTSTSGMQIGRRHADAASSGVQEGSDLPCSGAGGLVAPEEQLDVRVVHGGEGRGQHTRNLGQSRRGHGTFAVGYVLGGRGPVQVVLVWLVYGEGQCVGHVVLEVLADSRKVLDHADVMGAEVSPGSDARHQQQVRRADSSTRNNDFPVDNTGLTHKYFWSTLILSSVVFNIF